MNATRLLLILVAAGFSTGCAVGNRYSYEMTSLPLPVSGDGPIGVAVTDSRSYVLEGDKTPDFVGLQRGGFGNPFDVRTESGAPLADDMEKTIARGLSDKGFQVTRLNVNPTDARSIAVAAGRDGLERVITLDVREWKSDAMMRLTLHYDLHLRVFDESGALLAEANRANVSAVGGAKFESGNAQTVAAEFERIIGQLFGDPAIQNAL